MFAWLATVDWSSLVKTIVGAGLGSASVAARIAIFRERRQTRAKAGYMAMRLAAILEGYVMLCAEFHYQNDYLQPDPDPRCDTNWDHTLPELPAYPDDADGWQSINPKLANQTLGFRNKIQMDQWSLDWTRELTSDELEHQITLVVTRLAIEAWDLAQSLRVKHGVKGGTAKGARDSLMETLDRESARWKKAKEAAAKVEF
jgi:hypothetical protein